MSPVTALALLFADEKGTILEHPSLLAAVRSGEEVLDATEAGERPSRSRCAGAARHLSLDQQGADR